MNIKHLIFGLLPLQSYGHYDKAKAKAAKDAFFDKIAGTGSEGFFKDVFSYINSLRTGPEKDKGPCAALDFDGNVLSNALLYTVYKYQVKNHRFAFTTEDDIDRVFGFSLADQSCVPTVYDFKVAKGMVTVKFTAILEKIKTLFNSIKSKKDGADLAGAIFAWGYMSYKHMGKKELATDCNYLKTTVEYRLLYGMTTNQKRMLMVEAVAAAALEEQQQKALDKQPKLRNESVRDQGPQLEKYPATIDHHTFHVELYGDHKFFTEQVLLLKALKENGVETYIVTTTHTEYFIYAKDIYEEQLESITGIYGSGPGTLTSHYIPHNPAPGTLLSNYDPHDTAPNTVQFENVLAGKGYANAGEAKKDTLKNSIDESCTLVYGSGDSSNDYPMLRHVLEKGGYIVVQSDNAVEDAIMKQVLERNNKARFQPVNEKQAKWISNLPKGGNENKEASS